MSMKYSSRVDANQPDIVKEFRRCGASVTPTHNAGQGFPDLVVGFRGVNYCVEIKNPDQPPSKQKLTPDQIVWHENWKGQHIVVKTIDDVWQLLGIK